MLRIIVIATLAMGSAFAEASVPKGATEIEPGVFKHTDAAGKTFIFRKTPFGVVKSTEAAGKAEAPAVDRTTAPASEPGKTGSSTPSPFGDVKKGSKAAGVSEQIKVVERGDVLEFERPSPFGSYRWKRSKNELSPEEREAWSKARGQETPAAGTGPKE